MTDRLLMVGAWLGIARCGGVRGWQGLRARAVSRVDIVMAMSKEQMSSDPIGEALGFLSGPLLGALGSNKQIKSGIDEMARVFKNLNVSVEALNETSKRLNAFMADVEEPIRTILPVVSRTVSNADKMVSAVSEPAMAAAPALLRTAQAFDRSNITAVPGQIEALVEVFADLAKRLAPLAAVTGSAGGLLGRLQSITGQGASAAKSFTGSAPATPAKKPAAKKTAAKKTAAKKTAAKKRPAKKTAVKKTAAKKTAAKKTAAKKTAAKKTAAKKRPAKKTAAKKTAAKKTAAKKR